MFHLVLEIFKCIKTCKFTNNFHSDRKFA